jgi:hypothetical protein
MNDRGQYPVHLHPDIRQVVDDDERCSEVDDAKPIEYKSIQKIDADGSFQQSSKQHVSRANSLAITYLLDPKSQRPFGERWI